MRYVPDSGADTCTYSHADGIADGVTNCSTICDTN